MKKGSAGRIAWVLDAKGSAGRIAWVRDAKGSTGRIACATLESENLTGDERCGYVLGVKVNSGFVPGVPSRRNVSADFFVPHMGKGRL